MPERLETVAQQTSVLKSWSNQLPSRVGERFANREVAASFGERHGSWFLQLAWDQEQLPVSAALALTNPTATPDDAAGVAIITAWAAATTSTRFVRETVVEVHRTLRRVSEDQLETWLLDAVQRAAGYNLASLTEAYSTPARNE